MALKRAGFFVELDDEDADLEMDRELLQMPNVTTTGRHSYMHEAVERLVKCATALLMCSCDSSCLQLVCRASLQVISRLKLRLGIILLL